MTKELNPSDMDQFLDKKETTKSTFNFEQEIENANNQSELDSIVDKILDVTGIIKTETSYAYHEMASRIKIKKDLRTIIKSNKYDPDDIEEIMTMAENKWHEIQEEGNGEEEMLSDNRTIEEFAYMARHEGVDWMFEILSDPEKNEGWEEGMNVTSFNQALVNANDPATPRYDTKEETEAFYKGAYDEYCDWFGM